jgi:hypothetical protein
MRYKYKKLPCVADYIIGFKGTSEAMYSSIGFIAFIKKLAAEAPASLSVIMNSK